MSRSRGFTIVELMITIVIMVMLLMLGVASFTNIQAQGRDTQRSVAVQAIATSIEQYYKLGNPVATATYITQGTYPGYCDMQVIMGVTPDTSCPAGFCSSTYFKTCPVSGGYASTALPGVTTADLTPPSFSSPGTYVAISSSTASSAVAAGDYVYIPLNRSGSYCSKQCTGFQLQYKSEFSGNTITINSKHQ